MVNLPATLAGDCPLPAELRLALSMMVVLEGFFTPPASPRLGGVEGLFLLVTTGLAQHELGR